MNSYLMPGRNPNEKSAEGVSHEKPFVLSNLVEKTLEISNCNPLNEVATKELYGFGFTLYQQDRFSEAAETFLYLSLNSKADGKNLMALGACYQVQSDFATAARLYQFSIDLGYADPAVHLHLGECLLRLNRKSEAIGQFKLAISLTCDSKNQDDVFRKSCGLAELAEKSD